MSEFIVHPICDVDPKPFDTRQAAQNAKDEHIQLCETCDKQKVEITVSENGTDSDSEPVDVAPVDNPQEVVETAENQYLPDETPSIDQDPVDWMPQHFVDEIQGVPTVNRKGYAVIASNYNVSVTAEPIVRASETDFEYAEFKAIATTENGEEYSGFGSAHVDRNTGDGGDDPYLLNELAETRALKRAVAWATGVGMTAIEEMR